MKELFEKLCNGYRPTAMEKAWMARQDTFDLHFTSINTLAPLGYFSNLQRLDLSYNRITNLEPIAQLSNLQRLDLSNNQIKNIEPIAQLSNLQTLDLSDNQISNLEPITQLSSLQILRLLNNQISNLEPITQLPSLQILDLSDNQISNLEPIAQLSNLLRLFLSNNQIKNIEPIAQLSNLRELYLSNNQIFDLSSLSKLPNLRKLNLAHNQSIEQIPQFLVKLGLPFQFNSHDFHQQGGIRLEDVQLRTQPISLFRQKRELIEQYYQEEHIPVNEGKVIFLGDGGVGKTLTVARFMEDGEPIDYQTDTTPGVKITHFDKNDGTPTIHFWDFGGQDILHTVHHCFLTNRTCYVIVVRTRETNVTQNAQKWINTVDTFAPDAPIILAINLWENDPRDDLDDRALTRKNKNAPKPIFIRYSAIGTAQDYAELIQSIRSEVEKLDSVKVNLPKSWAGILTELRSMKNKHIPSKKYFSICKRNGLTDPEIRTWLLDWCNDLGICFNYRKEGLSHLENYKLLNPQWFSNAVYNITKNNIDREDPNKPLTENGIIPHSSIFEYMLNSPIFTVDSSCNYEHSDLGFILDIMRKFFLSYRVDRNTEFIPALCPNKTPENLHPLHFQTHICCKVKYDFLPENVIHYLMIQFYDELKIAKSWRKGLYLDASWAKVIAICDMSKNDNILLIDIYGITENAPCCLILNHLRNRLDEINSSLQLQSELWIITEDGAELSLPSLLVDKQDGQTFIRASNARGERKSYNIDQCLGSIYGSNAYEAAKQTSFEDGLKEGVHRQELLDSFIRNQMEQLSEGITTANKKLDKQESYSIAILSQLATLTAEFPKVGDLIKQQDESIQQEIKTALSNCKTSSWQNVVFDWLKDDIRDRLKTICQPEETRVALATTFNILVQHGHKLQNLLSLLPW